MKRLFISFLLFIGLLPTVFAQDYSVDYIRSYDVEIEVLADGGVTVLEKILYDFGDVPGHGIIRKIPLKYGDEGVTIPIEVLSVTDENFDPYNYEIEKSYFSYDSSDIKVGDADKEIYGRHWYYLKYQSGFLVNGFEDHDEFYWNVTGNEWAAIIENVDVTVKVPAGGGKDFKFATCYTGFFGDAGGDCDYEVVDDRSFKFRTTGSLPAYSALSIVAAFEKGLVRLPVVLPDVAGFVDTYLPLLLFFGGIFGVFWLWFKKGRDLGGKGTIMPFYKPADGLSPGEMGVLVDEKADLRDISATIVQLAVKGYLKIEKRSKKYSFIRLKELGSEVLYFERLIFEAIFSGDEERVRLGELKSSFYRALDGIKENLYKAVIGKGYFLRAPDKVRRSYMWKAGILLVVSFLVAFTLAIYFEGPLYFLLPLVFVEMFVFSFFMPRKTALGTEVYERVLGFKMFMETAEKDRIAKLFSPKEYAGVFESYLPFAIVLKVEKKWAKQFEGLYEGVPEWYAGGGIADFDSFIDDLGDFRSSAESSYVPVSSSGGWGSGYSGGWSGSSGFGGGGFSGGGFGGGGGGRW